MKSYSGMGLRSPHYQSVLDGKSQAGWFEVISENFIDSEGKPLWVLEKVRENYSVGVHGVSLNIGSPDELNWEYLKKLKILARRIQPSAITDHFCWGGVEGRNWHDLLPLPLTEEMITHVVDRIKQVQDFLGRRIALENTSTYLKFKEDEMPEWEFIREISERADSYLLLDINNVYVNSFNHGFDPQEFIRGIPAHRVIQYHLAGHSNLGTFLFDTHDADVIDPVWDLFKYAVEEIGPRPFIIERDDHIPSLDAVEAEVRRAEEISEAVIEKSFRNIHEQKKVSINFQV